MHAWQPKIPDQIGLDKWRDEAARSGVDMHRNVELLVARQAIEGVCNFGHRFVLAGESHAEGGHDADGVLVRPASSTSSGVMPMRPRSSGISRSSTSK